MAESQLSFQKVYEEHFQAVWGFLAARGLHGADREDAAQEVFVTVHQRLSTFEGRSRIRTWIFGIAINVVRGQRRKRATRPLGEELEQFPEPKDPKSSPAQSASNKEDADFLITTLESLSEPQREIFTLVEFDGVSVVDAARLLDQNEDTLRSRLRAARRFVNRAVARRKALGSV